MKTFSIKNPKNIKISSLYFDQSPKTTWIADRLVSDDGNHLVFTNSAPFKCIDRGKEREFPLQLEQYFWREKWFNIFAHINPDGSFSRWYCNVATPAKFDGKELTFTDLDLDLSVLPDGKYEVLDRDEFEENKEKFGYPKNTIAKAETALTTLKRMVEKREYPFNKFLV